MDEVGPENEGKLIEQFQFSGRTDVHPSPTENAFALFDACFSVLTLVIGWEDLSQGQPRAILILKE